MANPLYTISSDNPAAKAIKIKMNLDVVVFGVKPEIDCSFSLSTALFDNANSMNRNKLKAIKRNPDM